MNGRRTVTPSARVTLRSALDTQPQADTPSCNAVDLAQVTVSLCEPSSCLTDSGCLIEGMCIAPGHTLSDADNCFGCFPEFDQNTWSTAPIGVGCDDGDPAQSTTSAMVRARASLANLRAGPSAPLGPAASRPAGALCNPFCVKKSKAASSANLHHDPRPETQSFQTPTCVPSDQA